MDGRNVTGVPAVCSEQARITGSNNTNTGPLLCDECLENFSVNIVRQGGFGFIACTAIIVNTVLCLAILNNRREMMKLSYHVMVFSLAITDALTGVMILLTPNLFLGNTLPVPDGLAGQLFCYLVTSEYLIFAFGINSVYTMTFLAIERWYAVVRPFKYRANFTSTRIRICLMVVWLSGPSLLFPAMIGRRTVSVNGKNLCCSNVHWIENITLRAVFSIIEFILKFVLPLVVSFTTLAMIHYHIRKLRARRKTFNMPTLNGNSDNLSEKDKLKRSCSKSNGQSQYEQYVSRDRDIQSRGMSRDGSRAGYSRDEINAMRLVNMCIITTVVFALSWMPNQVYLLLFRFDVVQRYTPVHIFSIFLCMSNSSVNPWLFCFSNQIYRRCVTNFLTCSGTRDKKQKQMEMETYL